MFFKPLFLFILLAFSPSISTYNWDSVDRILKKAIEDTVTPGLSALVGNKDGILYYKTFGSLTYGLPPPYAPKNSPVLNSTLYDIASLTKVVSATTAVMLLYEQGYIHLDMKLSDPFLLGPEFGQNGKQPITIKHLLLHNSGLPPGPTPIYSSRSFGCPESLKSRPRLAFTCLNKIYEAVLKQKTVNPVGSITDYSDLSMVILSFAIGKVSKDLNLIHKNELRRECRNQFNEHERGLYMCYYDAFVQKNIFDYYHMDDTTFIPDEKQWGLIAPEWNETGIFRNQVIQGEVSDENAFALSGISGNAGLFSTSHDLYKLTYFLMFNEKNHLNKTTTDLFTRVYDYRKSSRALGWDTNHYGLNSHRGCGNLSESTFTHTGYTGTQICGDKERGIIAILLTNRCYPDKTRTSTEVKYLRRAFSNAIIDVLDSHKEHQYERNG